MINNNNTTLCKAVTHNNNYVVFQMTTIITIKKNLYTCYTLPKQIMHNQCIILYQNNNFVISEAVLNYNPFTFIKPCFYLAKFFLSLFGGLAHT